MPLVPPSENGTPLRGVRGSARHWIWSRRGYSGTTVKVFWVSPSTYSGLEWRRSRDGRMYAALVRKADS